MTSHLDILRAIQALALRKPLYGPGSSIDPDLEREAGMDGNYQRLLQAARTLDAAGPLSVPGIHEALTMANARLLVHVVAFVGPRGPVPLDQLGLEEPELQRLTAVNLMDGTSSTTQRDGDEFWTQEKVLRWASRVWNLSIQEVAFIQRDGGYTLLAR
jgi:hypothetical protein